MEELDLKKFANTVWQKKWIVLSIIVLFTIAGFIYSYFMVVPKYKSSTQIVLTTVESTNKEEESADSLTQTDITLNKNMVDTYSKIIKSKKVLKQVIENTGVDITESKLESMISVSTDDSSTTFKINVVDENPDIAKILANEVTNVFVKQNEEIYRINNINVLDEAVAAETPYNVHHSKDVAIFFALGVFVSLGLMLLIYMLDTSIKGPEDIEYIKMQLAGTIPLLVKQSEEKMAKDGKKKTRETELIVMENSKSPVTEAFRTLRTNIIYAREDRPVETILITSANSQEGKSYVSANLAAMFAKTNRKVILVDADMRKGRQNKIFKVSNSQGLSNCLRDMTSKARMDIKEVGKYIKTTNIPNLHLMTSGDKPSNSAELLSAQRVVKLIEMLTTIYDLVIFDGTPSAIVSDSIAMSRFMDLNYIVTAYKSTKLESLDKVRKAIENVGGQASGVILNKYELSKTTYSYNYYYDNNRKEKLEGESTEKVRSVAELIDDASKKKINKKFDFDSFDRDDFSNRLNNINNSSTMNNVKQVNVSSDISVPTTVGNSGSNELVQFKLENMSGELSSIKNMFIQLMMNNDKVTSEDIELLKDEINSMKQTMEDTAVNNEVREMREELDNIKSMTESMAEMQRENNEKVRKFLLDYKSRKEAARAEKKDDSSTKKSESDKKDESTTQKEDKKSKK